MRPFIHFAIVVIMSTLTIAQSLPTPQAVTDPKQIASKPNAQVEKTLSIEKLYMTRQVGASDWSPDGKQIVFVSNISGRNNLWLVPAEGGWPLQLTVSDQRQTSPAWSPDGKWIAYQSDYDGDEQWDLFIVSPKTGQVVNLTNTREIAEMSPTWSPDGRYLAYMVKPKTSSVFEIDIFDMVMRKVQHLTTDTPKDKMNVHPIWSKDGKWIAYTQRQAKGTDSNVFVAEVATGKASLLTEHSGELLYTANDFSPDEKKLLITSNTENGYENVGLLDIASKKITWLTRDKWEIDGGEFSPDGKRLTWTANVDGNADIFVHDLATGKTTSLPLPKGVNELGGKSSAFTKDGARLLYYHNGPTAPNGLWAHSMATGKSQQVTHSLVAGMRGEDMVEPFLAHYPSKDGKWTISAFVYVPYNLPRNGQHPAIVLVHGGPTAQTVNSFNRFVQHVANEGYIVIAPNYRGSTGYGKEFQHANLFDMGGGDLQDVLSAADWIKQSGYVDPKKVVIMGGSYGGYMSMMAVTKAPDMWAAGVPIVPFVNYFTEIENEDPVLREMDIATMGDPEKNKDLLRDRSPIFFVDQIKAPLLLLAVYENEGHGFSRVDNQIDAYKRVADFLKAHVPPADCSCEIKPL
ncbi:MAG: hypothetical protein DMG83_06270 [Acidobacteria bacterium]|nr:MAG: hypothetical protein DMG83_06270 [Acidobacteriota bacterium]